MGWGSTLRPVRVESTKAPRAPESPAIVRPHLFGPLTLSALSYSPHPLAPCPSPSNNRPESTQSLLLVPLARFRSPHVHSALPYLSSIPIYATHYYTTLHYSSFPSFFSPRCLPLYSEQLDLNKVAFQLSIALWATITPYRIHPDLTALPCFLKSYSTPGSSLSLSSRIVQADNPQLILPPPSLHSNCDTEAKLRPLLLTTAGSRLLSVVKASICLPAHTSAANRPARAGETFQNFYPASFRHSSPPGLKPFNKVSLLRRPPQRSEASLAHLSDLPNPA